MKKIYLIGLLFFTIVISANAQKKSDVVQAGIEVQRSFEIDYENGITQPYLEKEEYFNTKGELIEVKEFKDNGKAIKLWFKYKYDASGNIIEELELDAKGSQKVKYTYKYNSNNLKLEKLTHDAKNRVTKKKTYEYELRK